MWSWVSPLFTKYRKEWGGGAGRGRRAVGARRVREGARVYEAGVRPTSQGGRAMR